MTGHGCPLIWLRPVCFRPAPANVVALDLKQQTYEGEPALSWWPGRITNVGATLSGKVLVVNQHFREVATLTGDVKDGWVIRPHDVVISGHDA